MDIVLNVFPSWKLGHYEFCNCRHSVLRLERIFHSFFSRIQTKGIVWAENHLSLFSFVLLIHFGLWRFCLDCPVSRFVEFSARATRPRVGISSHLCCGHQSGVWKRCIASGTHNSVAYWLWLSKKSSHSRIYNEKIKGWELIWCANHCLKFPVDFIQIAQVQWKQIGTDGPSPQLPGDFGQGLDNVVFAIARTVNLLV